MGTFLILHYTVSINYHSLGGVLVLANVFIINSYSIQHYKTSYEEVDVNIDMPYLM